MYRVNGWYWLKFCIIYFEFGLRKYKMKVKKLKKELVLGFIQKDIIVFQKKKVRKILIV